MKSRPAVSRLISSIIVASIILSVWFWLGKPAAIEEPAVQGLLQCVSYTPFRDNQSPFDLDQGLHIEPKQIQQDLQLLAQHTQCIRLYASEGMEQIPPLAKQAGLKVLMGGWVSSDPVATRKELDKLVSLANTYPDTISAVIVGNEALLRQEITADHLAELIREVKARVKQPVSYADVWEYQLRNPQVGAASDFITIHILPYWEDQPVAIGQAIDHVRHIRQQVVQRFPGKQILIGETGWPSVGRMREGALPSVVNEARFIRGFVSAARNEGWDYNIIEAFDQPWKRRLEGAVGGYWGVFDNGRNDKHILAGEVSNHPQWLQFAATALPLGILLVLLLRIPAPLSPLVAGAVLGWSLQLEQLLLIVRDSIEGIGALLLLATLLASYTTTLARLAGVPLPISVESLVTRLLGALAAIVSLWLLFDPRYRDFFIAGFLPASLLLFLARRIPVTAGNSAQEFALVLLLASSAILIAFIETLQNLQALAWCGSNLLLATALFTRVRGYATQHRQ